MSNWPRWVKVLELLVLIGLLAVQVPSILDGQWVGWVIAILAACGVVYLLANWSSASGRRDT